MFGDNAVSCIDRGSYWRLMESPADVTGPVNLRYLTKYYNLETGISESGAYFRSFEFTHLAARNPVWKYAFEGVTEALQEN